MSLPGWRTSANQRRRIREAAEERMPPRTPPREEGRRVRPRYDEYDTAPRTRRFRWWQQAQEEQLQRLVDDLVLSPNAIQDWIWTTTEGDYTSPPTVTDEREERMRAWGNPANLGDMLSRDWRTRITLPQLRRMQTAFSNEFGFRQYVDDRQVNIYPRIPGLNLHRVDREQFPRHFTNDGQIFSPTAIWEHDRGTRQDGVRPIRENNSQDPQDVVSYRNRRGLQTVPMWQYLGAGNIRHPRGSENIPPEYR